MEQVRDKEKNEFPSISNMYHFLTDNLGTCHFSRRPFKPEDSSLQVLVLMFHYQVLNMN